MSQFVPYSCSLFIYLTFFLKLLQAGPGFWKWCYFRTIDGHSDMFDLLTGIRQGCILSTFLFLVVMNFIVKKLTSNLQYGIRWQTGRLLDLHCSDDITMISNSPDIMQHMTYDLNDNASKVGLCISCEKMKVMSIGVIPVPQIHVGWHMCKIVQSSIGFPMTESNMVKTLHQQCCQVLPLYFSCVINSTLCLWNMEINSTKM